MIQVQKVIEQLGYSAKEAKVYLAVLGAGERRVSDIAQQLKMPRSSVQVIVDKLHKDGLLDFYERLRYKYWVAENPEHLLDHLRLREEEVRAALPALTAMRRAKTGGKTDIKMFKGIDEIKLIYEDMLDTRQHICGIIPWDEWIALLGRGFMEDFIENRVRRYLRMRLLISHSPLADELKSRDAKELRETRYMPHDVDIRATILVYGGKVAIASLNKTLPTAVLIEDPGVFKTNTDLFEELWQRSEEQVSSVKKNASRTDSTSSRRVADESFFRVLADGSPQPLLIANEKTEIQYVNAAWSRQFGYSIGEVYGKLPAVFRSDQTPRDAYKRMWEALRAGKPFQSDELVDRRKDGTFFNIMTTVFPIRSGDRLYYVQLLDDVTEKKAAERRFREAARAAEEDVRPSFAKLGLLQEMLRKSEQRNLGELMKVEIAKLDALVRKLLSGRRGM